MDGYTHLYIENLRPYVVMLDEEVNAARQVLRAEKCADFAVENLRSRTLPTQSSGVLEHMLGQVFQVVGGADGTRTRDPRRDRGRVAAVSG
jgi:hypothetical protein